MAARRRRACPRASAQPRAATAGTTDPGNYCRPSAPANLTEASAAQSPDSLTNVRNSRIKLDGRRRVEFAGVEVSRVEIADIAHPFPADEADHPPVALDQPLSL